jgi:ribosome-binding factor A
MSRRTERLAATIQQELAMIIVRYMADPRIKFTPAITQVKVTDDLAFADIFITIMGTPADQQLGLNALKHAGGMLRQKLSDRIDVRTMPYLRFHYDEGQKKELEMLELLHRIEQERKDREAAQGIPPAADETTPATDSTEKTE